MEGISFQQTAVSLPLSRLPIEISGGAGKSSPLLFNSCFSTLSLSCFTPPLSGTEDRRRIFFTLSPGNRLCQGERGVASPLSNVHQILITMSNQWSCRTLAGSLSLGPATDKIQFARRKQAAKMLVCPPELYIRDKAGEIDGQRGCRTDADGALSGDLRAFDPEGHCAKIRGRAEGSLGRQARMQNTNPGGRRRRTGTWTCAY